MVAFLFVSGLVFLIIGAEILVRGASRIAGALGISPLVIGLTVVAFGTSAPELAVSIKAVLTGQSGIALGNVIGSNIFNVLLILGISALIAPLVVSVQLVRLDVPLMIIFSAAVLFMAIDGNLGRIDGLLLFCGFIGYTIFLIYQSRKERIATEDDRQNPANGQSPKQQLLLNIAMVCGGLLLLILGSRWLVESAVIIATRLGISELIIGLTIIAAGTSLPEVVTSIIASIRGERDIAVGNVVGSNLFNIMVVLGLSSVVAPNGMAISDAVFRFDIPVMIAVAFVCLPIFFTDGQISRWEGALLLGYYVAYTSYLVLAATQHDALPIFSSAMLFFVIPLTAITLSVILFRAIKHRATL